MIKLLFCDDAHTFGGAQIAFLRLIESLSKLEGIEIICLVSFKNTQFYEEIKKIKNIALLDGYKTFPFGVVTSFVRFAEYINIQKNIRQIDPDYIYINQSGIEFGIIYSRVALKLKVPFSLWMHNPEYYQNIVKGGIIRDLFSKIRDCLADILLVKKDQSIIAVSQFTKDKLLKRGFTEGKIILINNLLPIFNDGMIDNDISNQLKNMALKSKIVAIIGRIQYSDKGQDQILEAAKIILQQDQSIGFVFFGDGPDINDLKEKIENSNLSQNFFFFGWLPNTHLYIKLCDLVLVPSRFETVSLVTIEAISQDVKIVTSDIPSLNYVNEYNRFKLNNQKSLAETLIKVISNEYSKKVSEYYEKIKIDYNENLIIKKHLSHINSRL